MRRSNSSWPCIETSFNRDLIPHATAWAALILAGSFLGKAPKSLTVRNKSTAGRKAGSPLNNKARNGGKVVVPSSGQSPMAYGPSKRLSSMRGKVRKGKPLSSTALIWSL